MKLKLIRLVELVQLAVGPDQVQLARQWMIPRPGLGLLDEPDGGLAVLLPREGADQVVATVIEVLPVLPGGGAVSRIIVGNPSQPAPRRSNHDIGAVHPVQAAAGVPVATQASRAVPATLHI